MSRPNELPEAGIVPPSAQVPPAGSIGSTGSTGVGAVGRWRRPWVRLIAMFALFVVVSGILNLINTGVSGVPVLALLLGLLGAAAAVWVYRKAVTAIEHRPVVELDPRTGRPALRNGVLLGLGLFLAVITVIAVFGGYRITGWGSFGALLAAVGVMACTAVTEEILLRGIVFRLMEEMTGTWAALIFSGVLFGFLHLLNPEATLWGAIAIALEAGGMLGAAYIATRSLWLPIGLHFGWNLAQGGIFATTVSGSKAGADGLFDSVMHGSHLLTGGSFGPEASIVSILATIVPTIYFLRLASRRGRIYSRRAVPSTLAG
jgi:membrane protease YdiL (CAAX protease family)